MRWKAIASVLLVVAIALLALNVYQYASPRPVTVTTTTTSSPNTPEGISLRVSVNGTTINVGENVAITATMFNLLGQANNVSASYHWPFHGLLMFSQNWPPCYYFSPFELVVLRGNYSSSQILAMGPGASPGLGCMEDVTYIRFNFSPDSDSVNVTGRYSVTGNVSTTGPMDASVTVTTNGYWDNGSDLSYPTSYAGLGDYKFLAAQHPFVKGVYTIAVADEWGELVVAHLTVE